MMAGPSSGMCSSPAMSKRAKGIGVNRPMASITFWGSTFSTGSGVLAATGTSATGLASGVANVVNHGGPVSNGAQPHAFVFPPVWYSNLGSGAVVEQSYAADPLAAGWWRATNANNGQEIAAGESATELVHIGQMAIIAGLSFETFIDTVFNFPTFAEAYRVAGFDLLKQQRTRASKPAAAE